MSPQGNAGEGIAIAQAAGAAMGSGYFSRIAMPATVRKAMPSREWT